MHIAKPTTRSNHFPHVTLWIASVTLALPLCAAGLPKLVGQGGWISMFQHWGYPTWLVPVIGTMEVLGVVLLLVPRLASAGATMIAMVMAGAAFTHATHHEAPRVVFTGILCGVALLIAWARLARFRVPLASRAG
jgi:putative oxidoreductase